VKIGLERIKGIPNVGFSTKPRASDKENYFIGEGCAKN